MAVELYNASNVTGFVTAMQYANGLTNGAFVWLLVAIVTVVTFILMKDYDTARALAASSFIGFLMSFFFWGIGMMATAQFGFTFILLLIAILFAANSNR